MTRCKETSRIEPLDPPEAPPSPNERGTLHANNTCVELLYEALRDGGFGLESIPRILDTLIEKKAWRDRTIEHMANKRVRYERLIDFITDHVPEGLGTDPDSLLRYLPDTEEGDTIRMKFNDELRETKGGQADNKNALKEKTNTDNVSIRFPVRKSDHGNSRDEALRRLRQERDDLFQRVLKREMTANAAMVEAGFRREQIAVSLADAESAARTLRKKATPEFLRELCRLLSDLD